MYITTPLTVSLEPLKMYMRMMAQDECWLIQNKCLNLHPPVKDMELTKSGSTRREDSNSCHYLQLQ